MRHKRLQYLNWDLVQMDLFGYLQSLLQVPKLIPVTFRLHLNETIENLL